ncbi:hypothetical protein B566_EDAN010419 [Ephemera danica]|nr:hypothetical protein B566_EDAN010419 [Ephemera danica]
MRVWLLTMFVILVHHGDGASGAKQQHGSKQRHQSRVSSNDTPPRSPEYYGLQSNDDAPPILIEPQSKIFDPRPQDINTTVLRHRMGKQFDPEFMSAHRPIRINDSGLQFEFPFRVNRRGKLVAIDPDKLPDWLRDLRFKQVRLSDGTKVRTSSVGGARLERKLQTFLLARTSCPVVYRWRDLGRRFWPRWIKEGHCPRGKQSCSLPPGMYCEQDGLEYKRILRWHCTSFEMAANCGWIPVHYPFVNKCSCKCQNTEK